MREYEAVVFDMDGVIFDSEKKVVECWQVLADKYGFTGIEEACRACLGTTKEKSKEIMLQRYGEDFPYETYSAEASKLFHERYDGGRLPKKTGIEKILQALSQEGKKIALASSTRRQTVESQLREAGLIGYFDKIICGDMVEKSKPEPDIYIRACKELGVLPEQAYAIEDSYNGIRSAYRAGMRPIMVPDMVPPDEEMKKLACMIKEDLSQVCRAIIEDEKKRQEGTIHD